MLFSSTKKQTHFVPNVGNFFAGLAAVAPSVGQGCHAFPGTDGHCRGWVQFIVESGRQVTIHRLWTLQPGVGNGKHILRSVCEMADRHQVDLVLKTLPFGRKPYPLEKHDLKSWYERYGFVADKKKMIRVPRAILTGAAAAAG
ncbi:MAG: hypothetical protein ABSF29_09390 [Tepidisphaeraceae bacterium]